MPVTFCPNCGMLVTWPNGQMGAMITCLLCNAELEIISLDPFVVDFPIDYYDDEEYEDKEEEESEEERRR